VVYSNLAGDKGIFHLQAAGEELPPGSMLRIPAWFRSDTPGAQQLNMLFGYKGMVLIASAGHGHGHGHGHGQVVWIGKASSTTLPGRLPCRAEPQGWIPVCAARARHNRHGLPPRRRNVATQYRARRRAAPHTRGREPAGPCPLQRGAGHGRLARIRNRAVVARPARAARHRLGPQVRGVKPLAVVLRAAPNGCSDLLQGADHIVLPRDAPPRGRHTPARYSGIMARAAAVRRGLHDSGRSRLQVR
jgi:hypothetical protein